MLPRIPEKTHILQKSHTKINRAMGKRGASFSKSMDFFLTKALKNSDNLIRTASL